MKKYKEIREFLIPTFYAPYWVNDDPSGLTDKEIKLFDEFVKDKDIVSLRLPKSGSEELTKWNDVSYELGASVCYKVDALTTVDYGFKPRYIDDLKLLEVELEEHNGLFYIKEFPDDSKYLYHWYKEQYPDDEVGEDINQGLTLYGTLHYFIILPYAIYDIMGAHDSVIRERVFEKFSQSLGVEYKTIYNYWLKNSL